jgi:hypothetical protein
LYGVLVLFYCTVCWRSIYVRCVGAQLSYARYYCTVWLYGVNIQCVGALLLYGVRVWWRSTVEALFCIEHRTLKHANHFRFLSEFEYSPLDQVLQIMRSTIIPGRPHFNHFTLTI